MHQTKKDDSTVTEDDFHIHGDKDDNDYDENENKRTIVIKTLG